MANMLKTFVVVACVALVSAPALSQAYPRDEGRGSSYDRDYDRKDNMKDGRDTDRDDKHESVSGMSKSGAMFKIRATRRTCCSGSSPAGWRAT